MIFTFESQVAAASVLRRAQLSLGLSLASGVVGSQNLQSAYCKPGIKAAAKLICLRGIDSISTVDGIFAGFKAF